MDPNEATASSAPRVVLYDDSGSPMGTLGVLVKAAGPGVDYPPAALVWPWPPSLAAGSSFRIQLLDTSPGIAAEGQWNVNAMVVLYLPNGDPPGQGLAIIPHEGAETTAYLPVPIVEESQELLGWIATLRTWPDVLRQISPSLAEALSGKRQAVHDVAKRSAAVATQSAVVPQRGDAAAQIMHTLCNLLRLD